MTQANEMRRIAEAAVARSGEPLHGIVSAVDPVNHAVKVIVQPSNVESGWLPVASMSCGQMRICSIPDINEHVSLMAMEGDAEHLLVMASQFDTVVMPPKSPATGAPAQPGELLIRAGCGSPPALGNQKDGTASDGAAWWHMTKDAVHSGIGTGMTMTMTAQGVTWTCGGCTVTLSASGLSVQGGSVTASGNMTADGTVTGKSDVKTSSHSLNGHVHTNGNNGHNTGGPVG